MFEFLKKIFGKGKKVEEKPLTEKPKPVEEPKAEEKPEEQKQ